MKQTFFEVITTCTARNMGRPAHNASYQDGEYRVFDEHRKLFSTVEEVKSYLVETYGTCKRSAMYQDDNTGKAVRTGTIYHFNNEDWSHYERNKWHQQDWVTVYKTTRTPEVIK